jgi:hypothetical protein
MAQNGEVERKFNRALRNPIRVLVRIRPARREIMNKNANKIMKPGVAVFLRAEGERG